MGLSELDLNLLEAWGRIGVQCQRDRADALRRSRRRFQATLANPPRAWCLAIRASDRRIGLHNADYEFPDWYDHVEQTPPPAPPPNEDDFIRAGESYESALGRGVRHRITLDGATIRQLTKPVEIPWPGRPRSDVARLLGRSRAGIDRWIDRTDSYPYSLTVSPHSLASGRAPRRNGRDAPPPINRGVLKLWGYDYPGRHGKFGNPIPIVYTPSPVDPNHREGRPPDPVWGTLWQWLWKKLPEEFVQHFERIPEVHQRKGRPRLSGWFWLCPGRRGANDEHIPCGRRARMLYAPMPVWTLSAAGVSRFALDLPEDSGLAGQWHPGEHETPVGEGNRSFACEKCWKVRNMSLASDNGWNQFVSYISGGLLYGREVKRPLSEVPHVRKVREHKRRPNASPRRDQVVQLALLGLRNREIASRLGMAHSTVCNHVANACRQHGVRSRAALLEKLRGEMTPAPAVVNAGLRAAL